MEKIIISGLLWVMVLLPFTGKIRHGHEDVTPSYSVSLQSSPSPTPELHRRIIREHRVNENATQ